MPANLHPLFVHFPIALLLASVLFDLIAILSKRDTFEKAAFWNLAFGLIAAAATAVTGLQAEESVPPFPAMHDTVERHETLAFVTLGAFALLFLWRVVKGGKLFTRFRAYYLVLAFIGVLGLSATAYYGGELVYKFGVGMQQPPKWNEQNRE